MSALNDATIRYRDAGLCTEGQRSTLSSTLTRGEASVAALDAAVAAGERLTLARYEELVDQDIRLGDRTRYFIAFGPLDPRINDFAMDAAEIAEVTSRALARGTPMAEDEIVWLERNVEPGVLY